MIRASSKIMKTSRGQWRFSSFYLVGLLLSGCLGEALEKQAEQIKQQEAQIARQRQELEALAAGQQIQDEKQKDCVRAFRDYFDKAQISNNRDETISLYRQGLAICPDDDVAHYELGRALADAGRSDEAAKSFESALRINPDFADARRRLEALPKDR
jgi:tetratricopeptide (TPR) repeat protein